MKNFQKNGKDTAFHANKELRVCVKFGENR